MANGRNINIKNGKKWEYNVSSAWPPVSVAFFYSEIMMASGCSSHLLLTTRALIDRGCIPITSPLVQVYCSPPSLLRIVEAGVEEEEMCKESIHG